MIIHTHCYAFVFKFILHLLDQYTYISSNHWLTAILCDNSSLMFLLTDLMNLLIYVLINKYRLSLIFLFPLPLKINSQNQMILKQSVSSQFVL